MMINGLLYIWDLIQEKKAGKLGEIIIWPDPNRVEISKDWRNYMFQGDIIFHLIASRKHQYNTHLLDRWRIGDVIEPALYFVCEQINYKIAGQVSPQILPFSKNELYMQPPRTASHPDTTGFSGGECYYNTSDEHLYMYQHTSDQWVQLDN